MYVRPDFIIFWFTDFSLHMNCDVITEHFCKTVRSIYIYSNARCIVAQINVFKNT
jgi:hypothetical protein